MLDIFQLWANSLLAGYQYAVGWSSVDELAAFLARVLPAPWTYGGLTMGDVLGPDATVWDGLSASLAALMMADYVIEVRLVLFFWWVAIAARSLQLAMWSWQFFSSWRR